MTTLWILLTLSTLALISMSLFLFFQRRVLTKESLKLQEALIENASLKTSLEHQRIHFEAQLSWMKKNEEELESRFSLLSQKTLDMAQKTLLEINEGKWSSVQERQDKTMDMRQQQIQSLLDPIKQGLERLEKERQSEQRQWSEVYGAVKEALSQQLTATRSLEKEASQLGNTLKTPHLRGAWGEIQLQRLVELSGMTSYCDFQTQRQLISTSEVQDKRLRPDMIIRLPQNRQLAVDAKAPLKAFLESFDLVDEKERQSKLQEHVTQLRSHVQKLSQKEYWAQLPGLDLVIMFIPSDTFLHHALNLDTDLFEWAAQKQVLIATPSSLIALLKVCSQNWHREQVQEKVEEVLSHGKELYTRLLKLAEHLSQLGKAIDRAATCYNNTVGSWQSRVLLSAKKIAELDPGAEPMPIIEPITVSAKIIDTTYNTN